MAMVRNTDLDPVLEEDIRRLKRLIEESDVEEARRLSRELASRWPQSETIQHFARVLQPPRVIPSAPGPRSRSFAADRAWLKEHAREYPGCWIATLGDRLIAAHPNVNSVIESVEKAVDLTRELPLLHFGPARRG
jgi:hypothetical protein